MKKKLKMMVLVHLPIIDYVYNQNLKKTQKSPLQVSIAIDIEVKKHKTHEKLN